jgi:diadenylate cyclase
MVEEDEGKVISQETAGVIDKEEKKAPEEVSFLGGAFVELGKMIGIPGLEEKKDKKEVQATITPQKLAAKLDKEELFNILKLVAPGTNFRTGINSIVQAGKGALIVVENDNLPPILDGGFRVNCRFTPQRLVELSKMDGAIVLSKDLKKISYANVMLTPDSSIKTHETGTRHKAAERTAKQIGGMVIAVSERRHEIALFYKNARHIVKYTAELLRKANEQMQMLEKHRELFDLNLEKLNRAELRGSLNLNHAINVIQKGRIIQKISDDLKKYIIELGNEGTLLKTRLKEITQNVEKETDLVLRDYTKIGSKKSKFLLESLTYDEILDPDNIKRVLAYEKAIKTDFIKGWRILSKTSLMEPEIAMLIKGAGNLGKAIHAEQEIYNQILGEEKAKLFKEEIEKIKLSY